NRRFRRMADERPPRHKEAEVDPPDLMPTLSSSADASGSSGPVRDTVLARVWDAATGKELKTLHLPGKQRTEFEHRLSRLSPDGRHALILSLDFDGNDGYFSGGVLRLFDLDTGELRATLLRKKNRDPITAVAFSPDGRHIVAALDSVAY